MRSVITVGMLVVLAAAVSAVGWAGVPPPPVRKGRVLDAISGAPLAGVVLTAEQVGIPRFDIPAHTVTATTDSLGRYSIGLRSPGSIEFARIGYVTRTLEWPDELQLEENCPCCFQFEDVYLQPTSSDGAARSERQDATPRFAIYVVALVEESSEKQVERSSMPRQNPNTTLTQEALLAAAVKRGPPVLTEADIVKYCWRTQRIILTPEGVAKWNECGGPHVPVSGIPLLVEVDGQPRYGALLWNPASSLSSRLPQFWCMVPEDRLVLGGVVFTAEGDTTYTEIYDSAVRQAMIEMRKLSKKCGE